MSKFRFLKTILGLGKNSSLRTVQNFFWLYSRHYVEKGTLALKKLSEFYSKLLVNNYLLLQELFLKIGQKPFLKQGPALPSCKSSRAFISCWCKVVTFQLIPGNKIFSQVSLKFEREEKNFPKQILKYTLGTI